MPSRTAALSSRCVVKMKLIVVSIVQHDAIAHCRIHRIQLMSDDELVAHVI